MKGLRLVEIAIFMVLIWVGFCAQPALSSVNLSGDPGDSSLDYDDLFRQAREMAFSGKRQDARMLCQSILAKKPDYHEVRVFLGRMYAWDNKYDSAREELLTVIQNRHEYLEPRLVLIDVEYWAGDAGKALSLCEEALRIDPRNVDVLMRKARILAKKESFKRAASALKYIQKIQPDHPEASQLMDHIQHMTEILRFSAKYRHDQFDRNESTYGPWHRGALEVSSKFSFGTLAARLNYAERRFESSSNSGFLAEIDAYPNLGRGMYAYLNLGYSPFKVFPEYRLGGELYQSLADGFEISGGVRYLNYSTSDALIYTGSLGKYFKEYWLAFRPYVTSKSNGHSISGVLLFRNYFFDADNYVGLLLGYGSSPVDVIFLEDIERHSSFKAGIEMQRKIAHVLLIKLRFRYEREEFLEDWFGDRFIFELDLGKLTFKKY